MRRTQVWRAKYQIRDLSRRSGPDRDFEVLAAAIPNKEGWKLLAERLPNWADRLRLHMDKHNVMDEYKEGKIFIRKLPKQQSIEDWNEAWTEFKSS